MRYFLFLFSFILIVACTKDDPCDINVRDEMQGEINSVDDASNEFALNPTTANCEAYEGALGALSDAIVPILDETVECPTFDAISDSLSFFEFAAKDALELAVLAKLQVKLDEAAALFATWTANPTTAKCIAAKNAYQAVVNEGSIYVNVGCSHLTGIAQLVSATQALVASFPPC